MEFLGSLGIDIKLLVAQIINFGLLLWLLKKFVYRPIVERIERDERELNRAREETEKLKKERAAFSAQKKTELEQARRTAQQIIAEAEEMAKKIKARAREEAEKEKQETIRQIRARLKEIDDDREE